MITVTPVANAPIAPRIRAGVTVAGSVSGSVRVIDAASKDGRCGQERWANLGLGPPIAEPISRPADPFPRAERCKQKVSRAAGDFLRRRAGRSLRSG
ncbi:hypothetical protein GCM10009668_19540 [Nocardioides dubius]|uniref:Uncharacterized protein n=1 Tax=Nocardioides dubius TaxID=317019 RepID=A0ABP4EEX0_9ACTN